ncbi:DUF2442 domain-containing protein [Sphingomonas faeni]|uniref:DUF2442 domain-containing protein n=1 Tax=Sphingomonas faeni TaxID=185950 RepID=UPI0020C0C44F|nr:DUF2442 domain-containing protein [Sphingomonas faeni]MCK8456185.1 DUF2442 domain-containing protein [Sphingomonas faeni]
MAQKTAPQLEAQFDVAEARGQDLMTTAVRAAEARYDHATGRVTLELTNGCAYAFPAQLVQDLNGATDDQLADVEVDGLGFNLHWPALDADLYVPALVSGLFGTRDWMTRELARHAGQATSPAKAAAARANGAKGGRPRKAA